MPSRNIRKVDMPDSFYHVYARGLSKQELFLEPSDYFYFINLFKRYLEKEIAISKSGVGYPNYHGQIELLCYCLMTNHFHLLLFQVEQGSMTKLMRSVMTSYSRYFNIKYNRSGAVFESRYKARLIQNQTYLEHISRYIHLNPRYWKTYSYSSIGYYTKDKNVPPEWLQQRRVLEMFRDKNDYVQFLADYESHKHMLDEIRQELADQ